MIKRIYIKQAAQCLGCHDRRTILRWALRNRLAVYKDKDSKFPYFIKSEFEKAADQALLDQINQKDVSTDELEARIKFTSQVIQARENRWKAKLPYERKCLSMLQKIIDKNTIDDNGENNENITKE